MNGTWTETAQGQTQSITVPASIPFFGGVSVWTRTFSLNLSKAPPVAFLEFDGIANTATVKLNGQQVGVLTAFTHTRLDVSAALSASGQNTLELDIDDRLTEQSVPGGPTSDYVAALGSLAYALPVAWSPDSGIFRDVSIVYSDYPVITNALVTQTFSSDFRQVVLSVRLTIVGANANTTYGAAGMVLAGSSEGTCVAIPVAADALACNITIANPSLWSPSHPTLHQFGAYLINDAGVVDAVQDSIGLRKVETSGNRILLNGTPLFLRGVARHDLYGVHRFVADEATIRQDFTRMQQLGVNYVRCIHYVPDPRVAKIADEMGMLLSEEIPVWAGVQIPAVVTTAQNMATALIQRDYNRASVIFWITGNGPTLNEDYLAGVGATISGQDTSRPFTFVIDDPLSSTPERIAQDATLIRNVGMKIYAQNAYWFPDAVTALVPSMPTDMPVVITEWAGSEGSDLGPIGTPGITAFPNYTFPSTGIFSTAYQAYTLFDALYPWIPFTDCSTHAACVSGMTFFNWQDVPWLGMPYFYPGHDPVAYSGLVYQDRTPKEWPQIMFQYAYELLPQ